MIIPLRTFDRFYKQNQYPFKQWRIYRETLMTPHTVTHTLSMDFLSFFMILLYFPPAEKSWIHPWQYMDSGFVQANTDLRQMSASILTAVIIVSLEWPYKSAVKFRLGTWLGQEVDQISAAPTRSRSAYPPKHFMLSAVSLTTWSADFSTCNVLQKWQFFQINLSWLPRFMFR